MIIIGTIASSGGLQPSFTYATNTANASLNVTSLSGYVAGSANVIITINAGVYVYSTSTGTPALTLTGGVAGDTVKIVNNGFIMGMGGHAGSPLPIAGGNAISLGFNTTIDNTNASAYIGGGGGGGGFNSTWGGGGAGGGDGGNRTGGGFGAGGAVGAVGGNATGEAFGGGGGRIFPGTGGAGGVSGIGGRGGGGGGGGGAARYVSCCSDYFYAGIAGGAGSAAGANGGGGGGGGGGGWGAYGGTCFTSASYSTYYGKAGGKAVALNGKTVTWVSGNTTRVYGAIS